MGKVLTPLDALRELADHFDLRAARQAGRAESEAWTQAAGLVRTYIVELTPPSPATVCDNTREVLVLLLQGLAPMRASVHTVDHVANVAKTMLRKLGAAQTGERT